MMHLSLWSLSLWPAGSALVGSATRVVADMSTCTPPPCPTIKEAPKPPPLLWEEGGSVEGGSEAVCCW